MASTGVPLLAARRISTQLTLDIAQAKICHTDAGQQCCVGPASARLSCKNALLAFMCMQYLAVRIGASAAQWFLVNRKQWHTTHEVFAITSSKRPLGFQSVLEERRAWK